MRALVSLLVLLCACGPFKLGQTDGGDDTSTATPDASASENDAAAFGQECAQDAVSKVTLCRKTLQCPTVEVDSERFPHCGFRVHKDILDIECVCDMSLCPMGLPRTCQQAAQLLDTQDELLVCAQMNDGRCASLQ